MKFLLLMLLSVSCLLSASTKEPQIVCSPKPVEALRTEVAVLQCHLEPQEDATYQTVKWTRGNDVVNLHKSGKNVPAEQREHFEGRTSLSDEGLTKGNLSLKLSSLKPDDSGRYKCSFLTETLDKSCYVNLTVGEPEVVGSHEPVSAVVGHDVILPCHLEPPFDVLNLTVVWKHNQMAVHTYRSREDDPDSQDKSFKNRTALFRDEMKEGNISLKLLNVTKEDEGIYTCFVPGLHSQVRKGNITLKVVLKEGGGDEFGADPTPETDRTHENDLSPGAIVGIVIVMIAIVAIVAIVVKRKCRAQQGTPNNAPNPAELPMLPPNNNT